MTRKEYLESLQNKPMPIEDTSVEDTATQELAIRDREHYMQIRQALSDFENQPIELTGEDFRAFNRNFLICLEDLQFTDEDCNELSDLDQAISMMRTVCWEWATSSAKDHEERIPNEKEFRIPNEKEFVAMARELYDSMLDDPKPRMSITSAGFTIELDIVDHAVRMTWGHINYEHYDNEY